MLHVNSFLGKHRPLFKMWLDKIWSEMCIWYGPKRRSLQMESRHTQPLSKALRPKKVRTPAICKVLSYNVMYLRYQVAEKLSLSLSCYL